MCPLSALAQLCVLLILIATCHIKAVSSHVYKWSLSHSSVKNPMHMHESQTVQFNITSSEEDAEDHFLEIYSENPNVISLNKTIYLKAGNYVQGTYEDSFDIYANFLGQTQIFFLAREIESSHVLVDESVQVIVIREERVIDHVFTGSVATLVSIIYVNFGCAIQWDEFRSGLRKPIGPLLGFISQFAFMPMMSYLLGLALFPDNPEMQLGMFFTGVSPAGGASNIWTLVLDGNIDLSITMTTISTVAAFGMMPLWLFTLGRVIFSRGNLSVPYRQISTYAVALIVPLLIGYLLQRYLKRVARFFARIIKVFGALLLLFIVIFAIVTNLYLFQLFSWQIIVAGLGLPWIGYMFGYLLSWLFNQPAQDRLAIAIETGIQNTGIAIFLLRFSLPQPQADLTTIVPVSVAIMTPVPLLLLYVYKKVRERVTQNKRKFHLPESKTFTTESGLNS